MNVGHVGDVDGVVGVGVGVGVIVVGKGTFKVIFDRIVHGFIICPISGGSMSYSVVDTLDIIDSTLVASLCGSFDRSRPSHSWCKFETRGDGRRR